MTTRSGKRYLPTYMCHTCHKFWGHEVFDFKCSHCATNGARPKPIMGATERLVRLEEWILTQKIINSEKKGAQNFLKNCGKMCNAMLYLVLKALRYQGIMLRAKDALVLIESGSVARGHIVASCVIDWWNIKTAHVGGQWPSYLVCYYGAFDDPMPPLKLPPRGPHTMLCCTETIPIRAIANRLMFDVDNLNRLIT